MLGAVEVWNGSTCLPTHNLAFSAMSSSCSLSTSPSAPESRSSRKACCRSSVTNSSSGVVRYSRTLLYMLGGTWMEEGYRAPWRARKVNRQPI